MKTLSLASSFILMLFSATQCSEDHKLQKNAPLSIGEVYVESLTSADAAEDSGYTLYIPITENNSNITLDSVYFRKQIIKLARESDGSNTVYVGKFKNQIKSYDDVIMSSDPLEEMKNKPPSIPKKLPFDIEDTECIVSYEEKGETRYFKIDNIKKKS